MNEIPEFLRKGERRIATVIFADVSGFTAMSERLDPEEVREIMNRCFGLLSEAVYDHGGIVDKYVGDCLMALFGLPQAGEDDAVRAVRAALKMQSVLSAFGQELQKAKGFTLRMRVGINTGLVVAGDVGSSQKSDFTVMGDTVNTASRIEHSSSVGRVWVGEETRRFVEKYFKLTKLNPVAVKGKQKKLQLYEVEGPREEAFSFEPSPAAAFVGRKKERRALEEALESALGGECTVAALVGEAGMGKTTLLNRFLKGAQARVQKGELSLFAASCPPQGLGAYGLFIGIARQFGGDIAVPAGQDPQWKEKFFLAFEQGLMRRSALKPELVVLEDIHFADAGSWELLGFLVNRLRRLPIMILCALRPVSEKNLYWHSAENYVPVILKPFPVKDAVEILDKCLGRNRLPQAFKERLFHTAGGNPFFLTELASSLSETGQLAKKDGEWVLEGAQSRLRIPDTIQAALLARLDQASPDERELLQGASVLGLKFRKLDLSLLLPDLKTDALIESLVSNRFLTKVFRPGDAAESIEFIHVLLQEVCYGSLLRDKRQDYHLRAARALEGYYAPATGQVLKQIADHYYQTQEAAKALRYQLEIARSAARRFAVDQGILYYNRCLSLMGAEKSLGGVLRSTILFHLGELHIPANELDKALGCFQESLSIQDEGDPLRVETYRKIGRLYNIAGNSEAALDMFTKAADAECHSQRQKLELYYEIAACHFRQGNDGEAVRWLKRVEEGAGKLGLGRGFPAGQDVHEMMPAFSFLTEAGSAS